MNTPSRMVLLEAIALHSKGRAPKNINEIAHKLAQWELLPVMHEGELAAVVIHRGPWFHVVAVKPGRWATRKLFRETFGEAIKKYGFAATEVMEDHMPGHDLAKRLGFVEASLSDGKLTYILKELKHA